MVNLTNAGYRDKMAVRPSGSRLKRQRGHRPVKRPDRKALPPKRKRKVAGPRIAPLIATPAVEPLSESEWQSFLQHLPRQTPPPPLLRSKLDELIQTYLGIVEAEGRSPSAREVATVLETIG